MKGVGHEAQRAHFPSADVAARGRSQELHLSLLGRFRVTALAYGKQLRKAAAGGSCHSTSAQKASTIN